MVGSSSTWAQEELDLFHVTVEGDVDVLEMIPEKFFDFSGLEKYHIGKTTISVFRLIVARNKLVSVQRTDFSKASVLMEKAGWFSWAFSSLHKLLSFKKTDSRVDNLSQKRSEKHSPDDSRLPITSMPPLVSQYPCRRLGPAAIPQDESERRIASISAPEKSSEGTKLFHSCREEETQNLGNFFCEGALQTLFDEKPVLDWVKGRPKAPVVQWRGEYPLLIEALLIVDTLLRKLNLDLDASEHGRMGAYKSSYPELIHAPYLASTTRATTQKKSSLNGIGHTTKSA